MKCYSSLFHSEVAAETDGLYCSINVKILSPFCALIKSKIIKFSIEEIYKAYVSISSPVTLLCNINSNVFVVFTYMLIFFAGKQFKKILLLEVVMLKSSEVNSLNINVSFLKSFQDLIELPPQVRNLGIFVSSTITSCCAPFHKRSLCSISRK